MKVFGVCGRSGSGKTSLLTRLIPWLNARGLTISTVKQAQEAFDVDKPGKDSYQHREAGAREVMIASAKRWALMHEYREQAEFPMDELLARLSPVDLVLVEGFRRWPHERIEVWRRSVGKAPFYPEDPLVRAVASDDEVPDCTLPLLRLDDTDAIGSFILGRTGR
ncbi:molybdopterin-guanine dinucleotide biosynthesis protein B [Paramagnetospirillum kuznetsovii]|uniref:Molybdopterin-guanine dinucleotide biosynthesis protein B n=1 Tax=Paramagnetospirillum kuznetsovii TaxID=2053833 RepID=A0A364P3R8_9PROT|nr:molybdopterin-guanine dinucleotide biosynthesis protein B [Paramagnetospirillum kuznetsovii]RAU23941.1 molybdopterin-guanine dinucleotide biosynthesis protein B [Paramagnetospirillum kuznetsovii]